MKILVIRLSSLGDIILTQPVCALLNKAYPDSEITLLCKKQYAELPEMFDSPVPVLVYEKSLSFHRYLHSCNFDLVIDLHAKFASILASYLVRAKKRVRYNKLHGIRRRIVSGNHELTIDSTVSLYASALRKLGLPADWQNPVLRIPDMPQQRSAASCIARVAIIPGATHFTKRYPPEQWVEFMNLNQDWEYHLFGSDEDREMCRYITEQTQARGIDHSGKLNLTGLAQALSRCELILSGDTGPMHLAASLGKPQIAIFGATHPRLGFRPLNPKARVLCADLPCQPCHLHGSKKCPLGHFRCMKQISAEYLSRVARELLS